MKDAANPATKEATPEKSGHAPVARTADRISDRTTDVGSHADSEAKPSPGAESPSDADGDAKLSADSVAAAVVARADAGPLAAQVGAAGPIAAANLGAGGSTAPEPANHLNYSTPGASASAHGRWAEQMHAKSPFVGGPAPAGSVAGHPTLPGAAAGGHRAHRETAAPTDPSATASFAAPTRAAGAAHPFIEANAGNKAAAA
ncbi:MAG TPA: hypothetical protein VGL59_21185, partial [Polyangia bacterium]